MKGFLATLKGKIIAAVAGILVVAGVVVDAVAFAELDVFRAEVTGFVHLVGHEVVYESYKLACAGFGVFVILRCD